MSLQKSGFTVVCSGFIAESSPTDPCFLYVFQIALNHKPFFAKNSLESKPPNHFVCSGSAPQLSH